MRPRRPLRREQKSLRPVVQAARTPGGGTTSTPLVGLGSPWCLPSRESGRTLLRFGAGLRRRGRTPRGAPRGGFSFGPPASSRSESRLRAFEGRRGTYTRSPNSLRAVPEVREQTPQRCLAVPFSRGRRGTRLRRCPCPFARRRQTHY